MDIKFYREWVKAGDLISFELRFKETDLLVRADRDLKRKAYKLVVKYRKILEDYLCKNPLFLHSLSPVDVEVDAPALIKEMARAGKLTDVGPMASVAGAIAEFVGRGLLNYSEEVIVENGGDIFMKLKKNRTVAIYAGDSPLSGRIGIEVMPAMTPCGICTSSGKVGHSLSFGKADAVTVVSKSAILADALATALANKVRNPEGIQKVIDSAFKIEGIIGLVIIVDDKIGFKGGLTICKI